MRQSHPAWRLLRSDHVALVASFLQRVFVVPNLRVMAQADLAEALDDELLGLLKEMSEGSQGDPRIRLAKLQARRAAIDTEIAQVEAGHVPMLGDTAIKKRFQQFTALARVVALPGCLETAPLTPKTIHGAQTA